jgi:hypothetical protein
MHSVLSMADKVPFYFIFRSNEQVHLPASLHNLHRQAINTCYTERTKTKREAGKVNLNLLIILKVNSAPWNFIYNLKSHHKHRCALANARKAVFSQFIKGAFSTAFTSEKWNDDKKVYSAIGNWFRIFSPRICQSLYDVKPKAHWETCAFFCAIGN